MTLAVEEKIHADGNTFKLRMMGVVLEACAQNVPGNFPREGEVSAGVRSRDTMTLFGRVPLKNRAYFYNPTTKTGRYPLDEALGLVRGCTPALCKEALAYAAHEAYDTAAELFAKAYTKDLTADILKGLARDLGPRAAQFEDGPAGNGAPAENAAPECVVLQVDGTGMPMRKRALRGARGRNGAKASTREVKLGVMFAMKPSPPGKTGAAQGAQGAQNPAAKHVKKRGGLNGRGALPEGRERDKPSTRHFATLARTGAFAEKFRSRALRRHPVPAKVQLFIGDGAAWVWKLRRTHFPRAVEILDFYHAAQYMEPLLDLWGLDGKERKALRAKWRRWLLAGRVGRLIEACAARAAGASVKKAAAWREALRYYQNNKGRMKYDEYLAKGWFIGSGVVESACRTVVGERFKRAGMRWSRKGAEALLPFRAALISKNYDALWNFIIGNQRMLEAA